MHCYRFSTDEMRAVINFFREQEMNFAIAQMLVPEFYADFTKKIAYQELAHYNFTPDWYSTQKQNVWQVERQKIMQHIPESDRYWIIKGKNWLHELFGKEFSEFYFGA